MDALLMTLVGVFGGGDLAFILAWMTGQLVPVSRFVKVEAAAAKSEEAFQTLKAVVDRQSLTTDVTNAVLGALKRGSEGGTA